MAELSEVTSIVDTFSSTLNVYTGQMKTLHRDIISSPVYIGNLITSLQRELPTDEKLSTLNWEELELLSSSIKDKLTKFIDDVPAIKFKDSNLYFEILYIRTKFIGKLQNLTKGYWDEYYKRMIMCDVDTHGFNIHSQDLRIFGVYRQELCLKLDIKMEQGKLIRVKPSKNEHQDEWVHVLDYSGQYCPTDLSITDPIVRTSIPISFCLDNDYSVSRGKISMYLYFAPQPFPTHDVRVLEAGHLIDLKFGDGVLHRTDGKKITSIDWMLNPPYIVN